MMKTSLFFRKKQLTRRNRSTHNNKKGFETQSGHCCFHGVHNLVKIF